MIKIVLDTNVLISAIVFGGKPRDILEKAIKGQIQLVLSEELIGELSGVLEGRKFKYPSEIMKLIITELEAIAEVVKPEKKLKVIKKDPEDNRVLECAQKSKADFIVSGDVHLLEFEEFMGTKILTPEAFLSLTE
ncbi:MAG: putative toxin-antitoxin system toxin component, PIN family [Candidatus Aminicenantes bacterium]|nr:putative toxin-antitoxin system toxin component, PIN family [Candidatus Aminicenantes bacterium]